MSKPDLTKRLSESKKPRYWAAAILGVAVGAGTAGISHTASVLNESFIAKLINLEMSFSTPLTVIALLYAMYMLWRAKGDTVGTAILYFFVGLCSSRLIAIAISSGV
ncbi:MAG TPA: hypothetical protein VMT82_11520 [candidate division Zixibacteria bacterium]|nr:hypothetical protein [candidate division Zixibacteria bacterium]